MLSYYLFKRSKVVFFPSLSDQTNLLQYLGKSLNQTGLFRPLCLHLKYPIHFLPPRLLWHGSKDWSPGGNQTQK